MNKLSQPPAVYHDSSRVKIQGVVSVGGFREISKVLPPNKHQGAMGELVAINLYHPSNHQHRISHLAHQVGRRTGILESTP